MMLELQDLHVAYGGIRALKGVSLQVGEGEIVTLIGANGAGKSTTLRTISGLEHAQAGKILYNGVDITGKPSKYMVQEGLILVPEGRLIFPDMTVLENLRIGAYLRKDWGFAGLVVTDWGALCDRVKAMHAGCDLSMPGGWALRRPHWKGCLP